MMLIENKFDFGQTVYLKTDPEQFARIVCSFIVTPTGILYKVCFGMQESEHYDFEISLEKNEVLKVT
jgi:hypothetical protein